MKYNQTTNHFFLEVKKLCNDLKPHQIYQRLNPLSLEAIIFFYAYYRHTKLKANIEYFLKYLIRVRLKTKGNDLKKLKISPVVIYSRILKKLLEAKLDQVVETKAQELAQAKRIWRRLRPRT